MPIIADHHMHTPLCQHAAGPMEAYVERGIELGLQAIGFADHNPLPRGLGANVRMKEAELDYYVYRVTDLQFQYRGQIEVLLGLEMDYLPGLEPYLEKQIAQYPWDYIIGSVHYLDADARIGSWTKNYPGTVEEQYARYYEDLCRLAQSGLCDIIAHFDVVNRCAKPAPLDAAEHAERALQGIARADIAMEINTSGYRHPELLEPQPYPPLPVALKAQQLGIPLLVNSDAHAPEQVGLKFGEVEDYLIRNGCRTLVRFAGRERETYAL